MEIHNCMGALRQQDLISQAIVYAKDIYEQHQFEVINTSSNVEELKMFDLIHEVIQHNNEYCGFETGWARTRKYDCVDLEDERLRLRDFEDRLPSRHIASILLVRVSISLESPSIEAEEVCEQAQADRDDG
ncbi:Hypothetical predicted protein [Octopus vulgaris]|uniref:Uncharacterized protein n=1 Tax=Octopus vulgaris TaxID=6645 RepID=A0AA36AHL8_OCTVU|nr:Hypothetical predicted protein [Octopus vulgaris]